MTPIVTIPEKITDKGELVVLPKADYENMMLIIKQKNLNQELRDALKEYERGDYCGPFNTIAEGQKFLKSRKSRK